LPARENAVQVFSAPNGLDPFLAQIRAEIDAFVPDVSTKKGRDAIASMAYKVAKSKTALDGLGKELVAELKQIPALIDAERKRMRDILDAWRDEVRKPVDDWEAEQAAIESKRIADEAEAAAQAAEALRREKDTANKKRVNNEILADLANAGLDEATAKLVITAVAKGLVRNVKINY